MIPLKLKKGCRVKGLSAEIMFAVGVAHAIYFELGASELVITSGTDGRHSEDSKHHCGDAIDLRRWTLPDDKVNEAVRLLKHRLGDAYDVVLEDTHIHVEYDPK